MLEKSREFFRDHENTVYHAGYPHSYRQAGKEPNIQISMSEDGLSADIDVDYRRASHPKAVQRPPDGVQLGHPRRRQREQAGARWAGLITWWQSFGRLAQAAPEQPDLLNPDRPMRRRRCRRTGPWARLPIVWRMRRRSS